MHDHHQSSRRITAISDPDLYALVLRLQSTRTDAPLTPQGHGAHALFLDLVRQVDPALAEELHGDASSKPFTIAILPPPRGAQRPPIVELRVTLLRAALFAPFTQALLQQTAQPALRIGKTELALVDVLGTPGRHPWAGYSSFAWVWEVSTPASLVELEFATATAIGQGTVDGKRQRLALLPLPETIFTSIARRWNELAPSAFALDLDAVRAACETTLVSRYRLESTQISLGKGPQKGFVGTCTYELPADPAQARLLALLADAVFFLGVGMKTARGMGLCRRVLDKMTG